MEKMYHLNKPPIISIVIPTYNRAHIISETLESVLFQTYVHWECIIVDDGSTDNTIELIKKYCKNDFRFKFYERPLSKQKGPSACRNFGVSKAVGNYALFLDSDDLLKPFCLEQRINYVNHNPDYDFLVFQTELFSVELGDLKKIPNVLFKDLDDLSRFISFDYPWNIIAPIYNVNSIKTFNITWNEHIDMHEDIDFHIKLLSFGLRYQKIITEPDVYIRMGNRDKISLEADSMKSLESNVRLLANIKQYLKRLDLLKTEKQKRLYGLSIYYSQLFYDIKRLDLIKKTAKIMEVPFFIYIGDLKYYMNTEKNKLQGSHLFRNLYKLTGVKSRIQFASMKDTTLAKYNIDEEAYHHLKVVHVATSQSGGAGIAAFRIHEGLKQLHVPSTFLTLKKITFGDESVVKFKNNELSFLQRVVYKFFRTSKSDQHIRALRGLKGNYEIFSFPTTDYQLHDHPLIKEASIIHLHWVAGFLDIPSFFKDIKKPIVWTLHDMNPFQGGFHYKDDADRNKKTMGALDIFQYHIKEKAYSQSSIKRIVAPSPWLLNASKASDLLGGFPHQLIYNGVDEQVFSIRDKTGARAQFNLPMDKTILLFVSETVHNTRKGFDILTEAFEGLELGDEFLLVAIGVLPKEQHPAITYLGLISDELTMSYLYSAADLYMLPSREDNLPNVMLEALLCGTPVISTPVGGMLSVIQNGFNGYLSETLSADAFSKAIKQGIDHLATFNEDAIRDHAISHFALKKQAHAYLDLYEQVLAENTTMQ